MSHTFAIIKPTAVMLNQVGQIITFIETQTNLLVSQLKRIKLTRPQAEQLYVEHKGRDFFDDLCAYMMSGPIVVMELFLPTNSITIQDDADAVDDADAAWSHWRNKIGATDPLEAEPNTVRGLFGISRRSNAVHGSDSEESAIRELNLFFP